jgi:alpha-galactosidase
MLPKSIASFLLLSSLTAASLAAQQSVQYLPGQKLFVLDAGESTYAFGINERSELESVFWGGHVDDPSSFGSAHIRREWASFDMTTNTTPQEYPGWGAGFVIEPALKATFASGNRELVLHYVGHTIQGNLLDITLKDIASPLNVHLYYRVYPEQGIIERWTKIENGTKENVVLESAQSAAWSLPQGTDYRLHWLTGRWGGEWQQHVEPIQVGERVLESRRGSTSHQANPWFAIDRGRETTEEHGPVWFGELGWSGSWRITVEDTNLNQVRIIGGYNSFDFGYQLKPGESLETPPFYAGYTSKGTGEASRILHSFQLAEILPGHPHPKPRPVLYNSWEATEFNVSEAGQIELAEKAAKLGAERFVIDDGWFGQRKDDHAGLGDWYVNQQKFPNGLKPVIDRVHALGMDFGIWVEPEMVNPDSDLYRKHPDWAMNFPGHPRTEGRNQLLLNLARPDVRDYIFHFLDDLVSNNDIAFLKWDYNRNWSEPGWDAVPVEDQKKIWVAYVQNLYDILDRLRAKHPKLEIESCSGGGGRVDLGIMRRTEEAWTSDNTDALDRLTLQDGFSQAYTPGIMMAWVTDVPNYNGRSTPLDFRFLVAMSGSLGIGGNLNKWSDADMQLASSMVSYYKTIRDTVQHGSLYRLISPVNSPYSATQYVSSDGRQAVLFAYLRTQQFGTPFPVVRLEGLDPAAHYRVKPLDGKKVTSLPETVTGSYLMQYGVQFELKGDYDATSIELERVP